jgi:hypothetical protein
MIKFLIVFSIITIFSYCFEQNYTHAQNSLEIKVASDSFCITSNEPTLNINCSLYNCSDKKIAIHSPGVLNIGYDSTYSWNLNVLYDDEKKCIPTLRLLSWKEVKKYIKMRPYEKREFYLNLNFKELISKSVDIEDKISIKKIFNSENLEFGTYHLTLTYFDKYIDHRYAIGDTIRSNTIVVSYKNDF